MKMSDVVSAMGNHIFAEIGLVIAAIGLLTVIVTTLLHRNREPFERARLIPFADEPFRWQRRPDERQRREEAQPPNRSQSHSGDTI